MKVYLQKIVLSVIVLCVMLSGVNFYISDRKDDGVNIVEKTHKTDMEEIPKKVNITIYTYGNEVYYVEGMLEVLRDGTEERETIYMENEVYGFYSNYELEQELTTDVLTMVYYGYLEGYANGESYYST